MSFYSFVIRLKNECNSPETLMELFPLCIGSLNVISGRLLIIVIVKYRVAIYIFPVEEKRNEGRRSESVKRREKREG